MERLKQELKRNSVVRILLLPLFRYVRKQIWLVRGLIRTASIRKRQTDIWLELGAGAKSGKGNWVTIDMNGQCDIYHDLAKGIPFDNNSVSRIYSSHLFEHLTPDQARSCLYECVRVLKNGGEFSIAVPNARLYVEAYMFGDKTGNMHQVVTPIDLINYTAYCEGHHKNMFDQASLCHFLHSACLVNVTAREFDPEIDLEVRKWESIYAKGYKAG